jgi:glycine cleavage system transcriptional repressor
MLNRTGQAPVSVHRGSETSMSSEQYIVLTAVGADRPGLVNSISSLVHSAGANLEDSRMAILGGEFALLILVRGSEASVTEIQRTAAALERELGLHITLRPTVLPQATKPFLPFRIRVTGVDHPGIVHRVSGILAEHGINVASLESRVAHAPLSGTPMFILEAELQVPSEVALSKLRAQLGEVCDEENLDFVLEGTG